MIWWCFVLLANAIPNSSLDSLIANLPTHPEWTISTAEIERAQGEQVQASAVFTPTLLGSVSQYDGQYPRDLQQHLIQQQTPWGISVQGGWQQGIGTFPTYDEYGTTEMGEATIGVSIPLLDGLFVNAERTELLVQSLNVDWVTLEQQQRRLELLFASERQFWKFQQYWALQQVAEQSLSLAGKRQDAFEQQYEIGTKSRLSVIDNRREQEQRRQLWIGSQQAATEQQNKLAYYWRTESGDMQSPSNIPPLNLFDLPIPQAPTDNSWSLSQRPDIAVWDIALQQIDVQLKLIQAKKLPKVNLVMEHDWSIADTKYSEPYVGLKYEYAPLLKAERGKQQALQAKRAAIVQYRTKTVDKATQDMNTLHAGWKRLIDQIDTQQTVVDLAKESLELERIRFTNGGSDLLDLIKRENNLLKAQKTLIKLIAEVYTVEAAWRMMLGELPF